jgi:membrane-bound lytic murein transglycosylase A
MRSAIAFALASLAAVAHGQNLVAVPAPNMGATCDNLDVNALADAVDRAAAGLKKASAPLQIGTRAVSPAEYAAKTLTPLAALARQGAAALCAALPKKFDFYRNAGVGEGHFTVYHNPLIRGSRIKKAPYLYPLFKRPKGDLAKLTTAQVLAGGLDNQGLELIYLDDPTEVNAVQVEGSATVQLDDGTSISVASDGHNGQPYVNFGKLLMADNKIPKNQVTPLGMTRARKYFIDHPEDLKVYWARNPHFVFMKEKVGFAAGGKFGPLTPGRSLAVDPVYIPLGSAVWFRTDQPVIGDNKVTGWASYGRVALGEDTGSGIKGAGRVDVFYGTGEYAQQAAAVTGRPGEIYVLLAK